MEVGKKELFYVQHNTLSSQIAAVCFQALDIKTKEVKYLILQNHS